MSKQALSSGIDVLVRIGAQLVVEGVCAIERRSHAQGEHNDNEITAVITKNNNSNNNNNDHNNHIVGATAEQAVYARAIESMVHAYGGVERFQKGVTIFG